MSAARPATRSGATRAVVAGVALAVVWGVAFATSGQPFFPLIAVGGILTGLAGIWVRRAAMARGTDGERTRFPALALDGPQAALAIAVAVVHLAVAHLLFAAGEVLVPELAPTAEEVYGRIDGASLWWAVMLAGVFTAPLEEVFWRGAIHPLVGGAVRRRAARASSLPGATALASALVYAAFHVVTGHAALVAAALLGGIVWGALADRTGSVGAPMLAHGVWACGMLLLPPV